MSTDSGISTSAGGTSRPRPAPRPGAPPGQPLEAERGLKQLEAILDGTHHAILRIGLDGRIETWNRGAEIAFGYGADEAVGRHAGMLVPPERQGEEEDDIQARVRKGARVASYETQRLRKDGTRVDVALTVSPVVDGEGVVVGAVMVARDLTRRTEAEARALAQARELRRANAALAEFVDVASHDFQEPLRMVASYTQLLEQRYKGQLDEDGRVFLHYARDGALRMQALVEGLLEFARVRSRRLDFHACDMAQIARQSIVDLRPAIEAAQADVSVEPLPTVQGDGEQLAQVLRNLLDNAIKFRSEKPPRIRIRAQRDPEEWVFTVEDNGIGIAPGHAERVFGIFQRLHGPEKYAGTGIGLAIAREIVERHGGRVWVESAPHGGAAFRFSLPAQEALPT